MSDNTNLVNEPVKKSFINEVFNFDEESRGEYLNMAQYTLMAIIPILILNKLVGYVMPMVDESKGSLEISLEVIIQSMLLFIGILLINKAIRYFPTYSGFDYQPADMLSLVPMFLVIMLSLQTRIGQKSAIVMDRALEALSEKTGINLDEKTKTENAKKDQKTGRPSVPSTMPSRAQPLGNNQMMANTMMTNSGTTSLNSLPSNNSSGPDFNSMYAGPDISYPDSQFPGNGGLQGDLLGNNEPMAANSVLGGGFGSAF